MQINTIKKITSMLMAMGVVLTAAACGSVTSQPEEKWSVHISKQADTKTEEAAKTCDAAKVYSSLDYTPEMFYGEYLDNAAIDVAGYIDTKSDEFNKLSKSADVVKVIDVMGSKSEVSVTPLPVEIKAGIRSNSNYSLNNITKYDWMMMKFPMGSETIEIYGAFTITGNTLSFRPLTNFVYDNSKQLIREYDIAEKSIDFDFSFTGGKVKLTNGESSVELSAKAFEKAYDYMYVNSFVSGKNQIEDVIAFNIEHSEKLKHDAFIVRTEDGADSYIRYDNGSGDFDSDGLLKFSYTDNEGDVHAYEFAYFMCGADGLVLADNANVYYYTSDYKSYKLGNITTDNDKLLSELSEEVLEIIAKKKNSLQTELMSAFDKSGIKVSQNEETGEIMLDSSVLFAVGNYKLSNEGKSFLNKFLKAYGSVILKEDYDGFVSKIMVEGHTDSTGKKSDNKTLSEKRAKAVLDYCLSSNTGLDSSVTTQFKSLMQAVGYADDYPVKDKNGKENKDASRRVSFKFVINIETD